MAYFQIFTIVGKIDFHYGISPNNFWNLNLVKKFSWVWKWKSLRTKDSSTPHPTNRFNPLNRSVLGLFKYPQTMPQFVAKPTASSVHNRSPLILITSGAHLPHARLFSRFRTVAIVSAWPVHVTNVCFFLQLPSPVVTPGCEADSIEEPGGKDGFINHWFISKVVLLSTNWYKFPEQNIRIFVTNLYNSHPC